MVIENMDVLVQMRSNFDKPEEMAGLKKKLTGEYMRGEWMEVTVMTSFLCVDMQYEPGIIIGFHCGVQLGN